GYVNAAVDGTAAANGALNTSVSSFRLGSDAGTASREWNGVIDEMRVSNIARSADWILTEYNRQNAPGTFITLGAEIRGTSLFLPGSLTGLGSGGPFFSNPVT